MDYLAMVWVVIAEQGRRAETTESTGLVLVPD